MLATERLLEIEEKFSEQVTRITPIELDGETLRLILYLRDSTTLRVAEQWQGAVLKRYSYYWLTADDELKTGWDNAPHHTHLATFPHHKHVGHQGKPQESPPTLLEEVMELIRRTR